MNNTNTTVTSDDFSFTVDGVDITQASPATPAPVNAEPSAIASGCEWVYDNAIAPVCTTIGDSVLAIGNDAHSYIESRAQLFKKADNGVTPWRTRIDNKVAQRRAELARMGF